MIADNLETERLVFRRLQPSDAIPLQDFFTNRDAIKFLNLDVNDKMLAGKWIDRQISRYEKGSGLCAVIEKSTGAFAGQCGIMFQEVDDMPEIEVGYHFLPSYWGKGYATEAATACRDLAFSAGLAESIISIIDIHNIKSQKVAERNGMKQTKQTRWRDFDVYIYRITRKEWEK